MFLIGVFVPAVVVWLWVGEDAATTLRVFASLGASFIAVALMFFWSLIRLPSVMALEQVAAIKALEEQRESADSLKQKRVALGQLLSQAEGIKRDCDQPVAVDENMITEWYERACVFLTHEMGEEYLHRFQSDAGTPPMQISGMIQRNCDVWAWANRRAYRLNTMLEAMPH